MYKNLPKDFSLLCDLRSSKPAQFTSETLRLLKFSVLQKKYEIYSDINGSPRGYITWADVNVETILRMKRSGRFPRYIYEWNEGDIRLILDVLMHTRPGDLKLPSLIYNLVDSCSRVAFAKRGNLKMLIKRNGRFVAQSIRADMPTEFSGTSIEVLPH